MDLNTACSLATGIVTGMIFIYIKNKSINKKNTPVKVSKTPEYVSPKIAVLIRNDLKMTLGKQLAQICHAGLHCYTNICDSSPEIIKQWQTNKSTVLIEKLSSDAENKLREINKKAYKQNFNSALICDAGRTQIERGSVTALGLGPADLDCINALCDGIVQFNEDKIINYKTEVKCNINEM